MGPCRHSLSHTHSRHSLSPSKLRPCHLSLSHTHSRHSLSFSKLGPCRHSLSLSQVGSGLKLDSCGVCGGQDPHCQHPYALTFVEGGGRLGNSIMVEWQVCGYVECVNVLSMLKCVCVCVSSAAASASACLKCLSARACVDYAAAASYTSSLRPHVLASARESSCACSDSCVECAASARALSRSLSRSLS